MLVIERKVDRGVCIGSDVHVKIVSIVGENRVRLGIEAPRSVVIRREELPPQAVGVPGDFRVLIVEDDPTQAAFIEITLNDQALGAVEWVSSCREAIQALRRENPDARPDLILLDLNLPDGSGLEVVAEVRSHASSRATPIVVLSCCDEQEQIARCIQAGANAFMAKSADFDEFREKLVTIADFWRRTRRVR